MTAAETAGPGDAADRLVGAKRLVLMGQIGAGFSHDLNNALGKIIGLAEMIQDQVIDRPDVHAELETLITVAEQGAHLVERLAACGGRDISEPRLFDLAALAGAVGAATEGRHPGLRHVRVRTGTPCRVVADDALVRVALEAMLDNAARWSGGLVEVSCRTIPTLGGGATGEVAVRDDGAGMTTELRRRAFEPFFTTRPTGEAPGVGLTLAKAAAEACGGRVEIGSSPGEGTTVRLILPVSPGPDEAAH